MQQFTPVTQKIIDAILEDLDSKIFRAAYSLKETDPLDYKLCYSYPNEKNTIHEKVFEIKNRIGSYVSTELPYLITIPRDLSHFQKMRKLKEKFIISNYRQFIERITSNEEILKNIVEDEQDLLVKFYLNTEWSSELREEERKSEAFANYMADYLRMTKLYSFKFIGENPTTPNDVINELNLELLKLESFMEGKYVTYNYFDFDHAITKLFFLASRFEHYQFNFTNYINKYYEIMSTIANDFDKGEYENNDAAGNYDFIKVITDLEEILYDRVNEFELFAKSEQPKKPTIKDLLESPEIPIQPTQDTDENMVQYQSLNEFLKHLQFNYPIKYSPISCYYEWKEDLKYLKEEIFDNLLALPENLQITYLQKIHFKIHQKVSSAHMTEDAYKKLLTDFGTNSFDAVNNINYNLVFFKIIHQSPPDFDNTYEDDYHPSTERIQYEFYNYHYGAVIKDALEFIAEQLSDRTGKSTHKKVSHEKQKLDQEHPKENSALDNLLESLRHKLPTDKGPFEAFNLWNSTLIKFKREVLQTLSKQQAENKKHYLDMVRVELEEKTKNILVTDEDYNFMLSQHNFDRITVMESRDSDDMFIGALASSPIKLDSTMEMEYTNFEIKKEIQDTFYNFHYGKTLTEALEFVDKQFENINGFPLLKPRVAGSSVNAHHSFKYKKWNSRHEKITELMNFLKEKGYIEKDTELALFRKLFRNELPSRKIIWLTTITDLSYFIGKLACLPGIEESKKKHWYIAVNYFELKDGSEVTNKRLSGQKQPADTSLLDNALNLL